jgi:putative DNA primase/helicase
MWEHYDHRCIPTWRETGEQRGFNDCVERAYKYANNAVGCRTVVGVFSALRAVEPLATPTGGWEENKKLGKKRVDTVELIEHNPEGVTEKPASGEIISDAGAALLASQITNKSSIVQMAKAFLAVKFPKAGLLRCDKIFYAYNGKSWTDTPDDAIMAAIAWNYIGLELPASKVKNIYDWVCHLTYQKDLVNNTWLDGSYDGDNTNVYKNTLVEVNNGITQIPHTRDFFCVNELHYDYLRNTHCPHWLRFLGQLWDDPNNILMLQEFFGYCLTSDCSLQKMGIFIGKSRAGKSVISDVLMNLVGEHNVVAPPLETIIDNSVKQAISQAKLVLIPEATTVHPTKQTAVLGFAKALSGGDSFSFHQLYKGTANARFAGKIAMVANAMPDFVDTSGALANRFLVWQFTRSFKDREDTGLTKRLLTELPAINKWAMEGLLRLQKQGKFTVVNDSVEMIEDMKRDMFPLADFIDDYCDIEDDSSTLSVDLHQAYLHWAAMKEIKSPMTIIKFGKFLKSSYLPVNPKRLANGRGFVGIKVKPLLATSINLRSQGKGGEVVQFAPVPLPKTGG